MGRPKSLLPFDGEPLIVHILRALKHMFAETVVVAAADQELPELPATLVLRLLAKAKMINRLRAQ